MDLLPLVVPVFSNISQILNKINLKSGMNMFHNSRVVKLRSNFGKYILAVEDQKSVVLGQNGSSKNAEWTVEFIPGCNTIVRLKSCYGKYLAASDEPFLGGMTGLKVLQKELEHPDSSVGWEPVRDGEDHAVRFRSGYRDKFLRADNGVPPWKNSVTHKTLFGASYDNYLWHVDIVEKLDQSASTKPTIPLSDILLSESSSHGSSSFSAQEKEFIQEIMSWMKAKGLREFIQEIMSWMRAKGLVLILLLLVLVLITLVVLLFAIIVVLMLVFLSQINDVKLKWQSIITNTNEKVLRMRNHKFVKFLLEMLFIYVLVYEVPHLTCSLRIWYSNWLH